MYDMYDKERVLTHAIRAGKAHAREVSQALTAYINAETPADKAFAETRLRDALVAQALGHESCAHDGSTATVRRGAALAALEAWDGPSEPGEGQCAIGRGALRQIVSLDLARRAGFGGPFVDDHEKLLAQAVLEGHRGDGAVLRVMVLQREACEARETRRSREAAAENERAAAGMRLAAERERSKRSE